MLKGKDMSQYDSIVLNADQALIYSEVIESEKKFFYRLKTGSVGEIPKAILSHLNIKELDLPVKVSKSVLMRFLNEAFVSLSEFINVSATKASITNLNTVANTKVSKAQFTDLSNKVALRSEVDTLLTAKANKLDMDQRLNSKADTSNVFSIGQTLEVLSGII